MLTSLFGDLGKPQDPDGSARLGEVPDPVFVATPLMESVASGVNARGQMVDRFSQDLVVSGSPAQAMRDHFAASRAELETATSLITLLDPAGIWASAVIKALSDAGGQPIERLHLREHTTLRTLATIERTTLVRRNEEALRIYHADVRAPGSENAEIPVALMERSQMTAVIVGALAPHAVDGLLAALLTAARLPTWQCPNLLFILPPNSAWIGAKISATSWPARLHVHVLSESMSGASSVWNAMLGLWNQIKTTGGREPGRGDPALASGQPRSAAATGLDGVEGPPIRLAQIAAEVRRPIARHHYSRGPLDPKRAKQALARIAGLDGLLGCAVVDSMTGLVLARESRHGLATDMDLAAAACAQVLRAHRLAARNMGLPEQIDELMTSAGPRQQIMRILTSYPDLFLVVLLDKQRTNLALARYQLTEVERSVE